MQSLSTEVLELGEYITKSDIIAPKKTLKLRTHKNVLKGIDLVDKLLADNVFQNRSAALYEVDRLISTGLLTPLKKSQNVEDGAYFKVDTHFLDCVKKHRSRKASLNQSKVFFRDLELLLADNNYLLARSCMKLSIVDCKKDDSAVYALVQILHYNNFYEPILLMCLNEECSAETNFNLFRENTGSTLLVSGLLKYVRNEWLPPSPLNVVLEQIRTHVKNTGDFVSDDIILEIAQQAFDVAMSMCQKMPAELLGLILNLRDCLEEHSNLTLDFNRLVVCSVVFLHCICPYIVNFVSFDGVMDLRCSKAYVIVSKLLQAVVNGKTEFEEEKMQYFNSFLSNNEKLHGLVEQIFNQDRSRAFPLVDVDDVEQKLINHWKVLFRFLKRRRVAIISYAESIAGETAAGHLDTRMNQCIADIKRKRERTSEEEDERSPQLPTRKRSNSSSDAASSPTPRGLGKSHPSKASKPVKPKVRHGSRNGLYNI